MFRWSGRYFVIIHTNQTSLIQPREYSALALSHARAVERLQEKALHFSRLHVLLFVNVLGTTPPKAFLQFDRCGCAKLFLSRAFRQRLIRRNLLSAFTQNVSTSLFRIASTLSIQFGQKCRDDQATDCSLQACFLSTLYKYSAHLVVYLF